MSDKVSWINYKGVRILKVDFSNLESNVAQLQAVIDEAEAIQKKEKLGSILRVSYIANSYFNSEAKKRLQAYTQGILPYTKASASSGFKGLQALAAKLLNPNMKNFSTIDEACEWLIKQ